MVKGKVGRRPLKAVSTGTWTFNVVDEETGEVHLRNVSMQSADDYMDNAHDGTNTKFSQYTEPGGENYKELLLTMPQEQPEREFYIYDVNTDEVIMTSNDKYKLREELSKLNNKDYFIGENHKTQNPTFKPLELFAD